ncbi:MAG TPA: DUF6714 family protein [Candidatus Acidoferrales bacterium]|nr:DUF6714 family protein [Candidatus Acidoferrales bacterium]
MAKMAEWRFGRPFLGQNIGPGMQWSQVTLDELERDCTAHLDALGFRYYIQALMLSVLDRYEPSSMRVIGTLAGLYPKKGDSWEHHTCIAIRFSTLRRRPPSHDSWRISLNWSS